MLELATRASQWVLAALIVSCILGATALLVFTFYLAISELVSSLGAKTIFLVPIVAVWAFIVAWFKKKFIDDM